MSNMTDHTERLRHNLKEIERDIERLSVLRDELSAALARFEDRQQQPSQAKLTVIKTTDKLEVGFVVADPASDEILTALKAAGGGPLHYKELSERTGRADGSVYAALKRIATAGYVKKVAPGKFKMIADPPRRAPGGKPLGDIDNNKQAQPARTGMTSGFPETGKARPRL